MTDAGKPVHFLRYLSIQAGRLWNAPDSRMILYGSFLILCGAAGFLSNPEKAKTALLSGGTFGGLSILWGILIAKGFGWSRIAALISTALLTAAFVWRAAAGWFAVLGGRTDKIFAASLISLMLAASAAVLLSFLKPQKPLSSS